MELPNSNLKQFTFTKYILFLFIFFISIIIIHFFIYSIFSISIYKLLCYDNKSVDLISYFFFKFYKIQNIFYIKGYFFTIYLNSLYLYNIYITNLSISNNLYIYYNFTSIVHIYTTSYITDLLSTNFNKELNIILLNFFIRSSNLVLINSISLQKTILLNLNESALFFFRIYNPSHMYIQLITLYMIYPNFISPFINKIQCFCFNLIYLYPLELIDLPVLVFVSIYNAPFKYIYNVIIYYTIFLIN